MRGQIKCQKTKILTPSTCLVSVPAAELQVSVAPQVFLNEGKWFRRSCCCFGSFFSVGKGFFLCRKVKGPSVLNAAGANLEPSALDVLRPSSVIVGMREFYLWEWWRISDLRTSQSRQIQFFA